jgi:hypothetical protein
MNKYLSDNNKINKKFDKLSADNKLLENKINKLNLYITNVKEKTTN